MHHLQQKLKTFLLIPVLLLTIQLAYAQTSDAGWRNVHPIDSPLQKLLQLEARTYEYHLPAFKSTGLKQGRQYGFLPENVSQVFPTLINNRTVSYMYGKNNYRQHTIQTVDIPALVPVLVAAIQELHQQVEQLKLEVSALKK